MARAHKDWLKAYLRFTQDTEAPPHMHFWCGVSAIAGALRRRVWLPMRTFQWTPNFYILLVAPPGVVAKSTTSSISMALLREVPGIHFGPAVVTWQALVQELVEAAEAFEYNSEYVPMAALTIESSELGNLITPEDTQLIDMLVNLWDAKLGKFEKKTKFSGNESVENPWLNLIACTTPDWIAGNFPQYMIGGGFTSRCIFVYCEKKHRLIAYPDEFTLTDEVSYRKSLISDLEQISMMAGPFTMTKDARAWGREWYEYTTSHPPAHLDMKQFGGYWARKQSHIHKLAMVLSAAQSDVRVIEKEHLILANTMVSDLERDMVGVFASIGKSDEATLADRLIWYVTKMQPVSYQEVYRYMHANFPKLKDFEHIVAGALKAGYVTVSGNLNNPIFRANPQVKPGGEHEAATRSQIEASQKVPP